MYKTIAMMMVIDRMTKRNMTASLDLEAKCERVCGYISIMQAGQRSAPHTALALTTSWPWVNDKRRGPVSWLS